jgi:hypothetical protein
MNARPKPLGGSMAHEVHGEVLEFDVNQQLRARLDFHHLPIALGVGEGEKIPLAALRAFIHEQVRAPKQRVKVESEIRTSVFADRIDWEA